MNQIFIEPVQLRRIILECIPADLFDNSPRHLYLPPDLYKALDPQRPLVVGDRGTGKTFLWSALASPHGPAMLNDFFRGTTHSVRAAFGATDAVGFQRLGQDTVQHLFSQAGPRVAWKTFLIAAAINEPLPGSTWEERIVWVKNNPESSDKLLVEEEQKLRDSNERRLVVFDAIDRDPPLWNALIQWHGALLRLMLDVQHFRHLRVKAFMRRDVVDDPEVAAFPDASKLRATEVVLRWRQSDLYALLWRYLSTSVPFRQMARSGWSKPMEVPAVLKDDEEAQRELWHKIVGPYMGKTARQGDTYRWLFNHLADADGQVSPRSFLAAVRVAAEKTPASSTTAIHFSSIHDGIKQAAKTRAREIAEDFPWLSQALNDLQDTVVPCHKTAITEVWERTGLEATIDSKGGRSRRSYGRGLNELIEELVSLHIFHQLRDGRVNVPDVFRLGFGMRRMGGVRP